METSVSREKLLSIIDKFKIPLLLALLGSLLIGLGLLIPKLNPGKEEITVKSEEQVAVSNKTPQIKLDIAGAVTKPGVYDLAAGSRLEDAIKAAGGFSPQADTVWIAKNLNLASKVTDGQKIYIQLKGEISYSGSSLGSSTTGEKVNINFASAKELDTLPGVGQVTAEKIIAARPYSSTQELLSRKVVGKSTYEKIKDLVSVN